MQRLRLLILLTACFVLVSAAWADDVGYVDCASHPENTQVFAKARQTPDIVGAVPCGERFTILIYGFVFSRIQTKDGKIGYVFSNLITVDRGTAPAPQQAAMRATPAPAANVPAAPANAQSYSTPMDSPPVTTSPAPRKPAATQAAPAQSASSAAVTASASTQPAPAAPPAPQVAPAPSTEAQPAPVNSSSAQVTPGPAAPTPAPATAAPAAPAPASATPVAPQPAPPSQPVPQPAPALPTAAQVEAATSATATRPASSAPDPASTPVSEPTPAPAPAPAAEPTPSPASQPAQPQPEEAQPVPEPQPVRSASVRSSWEKPLPAGRQNFLLELYSGYAFARFTSGGTSTNLNGAMGAFGYNLKPWLQIVGDTSYNFVTISGTKTVLYGNHFGGRFFYRRGSRWGFTPFVEALVGGSRLDTSISGVGGYSTSTNCISYKAGGGIDVRVKRRWEIRVIDVDYYRTTFGTNATQNNYWASAGVILRLFGTPGE